MGGRLGLDEALQQVQKHRQADPEKAFEGWSQARIRAYQMINENPNSYYYRFNAPGEVQRRGQWTEVTKPLTRKHRIKYSDYHIGRAKIVFRKTRRSRCEWAVGYF